MGGILITKRKMLFQYVRRCRQNKIKTKDINRNKAWCKIYLVQQF